MKQGCYFGIELCVTELGAREERRYAGPDRAADGQPVAAAVQVKDAWTPEVLEDLRDPGQIVLPLLVIPAFVFQEVQMLSPGQLIERNNFAHRLAMPHS